MGKNVMVDNYDYEENNYNKVSNNDVMSQEEFQDWYSRSCHKKIIITNYED